MPVLLILSVLLGGCGLSGHPIRQYLEEHYTLDSLRPSAFRNEEAFVYRTNLPVPEVAAALAGVLEPRFQTTPPRDDRMVLVWNDYLADIARDIATGDTLIVWQSRQFAADHYDTNTFFAGYLAAEIIDEVFDGLKYLGRSSRYRRMKSYRDARSWPYRGGEFGRSVRTGSTGGPRFGGGGFFGGK